MLVCLVAQNRSILQFQVVAVSMVNILMMWNILRYCVVFCVVHEMIPDMERNFWVMC